MYKKYLAALLLLGYAEILSAQGVKQLWLSTAGGKYAKGAVISVDGAGNNLTKWYDFKTIDKTSFVEYQDGKYYGISEYGIFEWNATANTYERKTPGSPPFYRYFNSGLEPSGDLSFYNGKFYGILGGNMGYIFEWDPVTNTFTTKIDFTQTDAAYPWANLTLLNGKFYGFFAGISLGGIFEWDPSTNDFTVLKRIEFQGIPLNFDKVILTYYQQKFYGTDYLSGSIYEWDPLTNDFTVKYTLTDAEGKFAVGKFAILNGKFYGVTKEGGQYGKGVLFEWDPSTNIYQVKHNFDGVTGENPVEGLTVMNNKLYGAASLGGAYNLGVLFEWNPATDGFTVKKNLDGINGAKPWNFFDTKESVIYGQMAGEGGGGIIFEWNTATDGLISRLDYGNNCYAPTYLAVGNGKIYGTTADGGHNNKGVIFEAEVQDNEMLVTPKADLSNEGGYYVNGPLMSMNGKFYGSNSFGGQQNTGTLFQWDPVTNSYEKKLDSEVEIQEVGGLSQYAGKYYYALNENTSGSIYEWDPVANQVTKKLEITQAMGRNSVSYFSSLTLKDDKFYGVIGNGGTQFTGLIYEWDPSTNNYTKKYEFNGIDGMHKSYNSLTLINNKFYGTTSSGGANGNGVIFEWDPVSNVYTKKIDFSPSINGLTMPVGHLIESGQKLYGTTLRGGQFDRGMIFEWDPNTNIFITKTDFDVDNFLDQGTTKNWTGLSAFPAQIAETSTGTCIEFPSVTINGNNNKQWVPITDNRGNVLAEVQPNGNSLGVLTVQAYINKGKVRADAANRPYLDRNITITPEVQPEEGKPVDIRLYITRRELEALSAAENAGINGIGDIGIFQSAGSCSPYVTNAVPIPTSYELYEFGFVLKSTVSSFSTFYFSNRSFEALPLQMIVFNGKLQKDDVSLNWTTDNENNVAAFDMERSINGTDFIYIGSISANNSPGIHEYNFIDKKAVALPCNVVHYRIKQKDLDGKYTYSKVISIDIPSIQSIVVSPNPAGDFIDIMYKKRGAANNALLQITDIYGKKVVEKSVNTGLPFERLNIAMLSSGLYILTVTVEGKTTTVKFVKI